MQDAHLHDYRPPYRRQGSPEDRDVTVVSDKALAHTQVPSSAPARVQDTPSRHKQWLFNPWVDFLTLGGGSFVALAALAAFYPHDEPARAALAGIMLRAKGRQGGAHHFSISPSNNL